jgi:Holliday junction resolvasome RuvABC endonuclease subunit
MATHYLDPLAATIRELCRGAELVVIEGLSFGSNMPSAQERAGLWFLAPRVLWKANIRMQSVAPTALKKFVCGKGSAEKSLILREVFRHWGIVADDDNSADAAGLRRIGLVLVGAAKPETEAQREVISVLLNGKAKKTRPRKVAA